MKTTMKLAALAAAMAFAGSASAALYCKNDKGQELKWVVGQPVPILKNARDPNKVVVDFDMRNERDVICFVNSTALSQYLPRIKNLPYISDIPTWGPDGDGLIYRGDMARFLIDNFPSVSGAPSTFQDYATAKLN